MFCVSLGNLELRRIIRSFEVCHKCMKGAEACSTNWKLYVATKQSDQLCCIDISTVITDGGSAIKIYRQFTLKPHNVEDCSCLERGASRYIPLRQTENTRNVKTKQMFNKRSLKHELNLADHFFYLIGLISYNCLTLLVA